MKNIPAEIGGLIIQVQHSQQCLGKINMSANVLDYPRCNEVGIVNQTGNVSGLQVKIVSRSHGFSVITGDDKDSILKIFFLRSQFQKVLQCPIGIIKSRDKFFTGYLRDNPGPMIIGGEHNTEKGFLGFFEFIIHFFK